MNLNLRNTPNRTDGRRAFTLVELLVVMSIIILLVALLLPAMDKARAAARTAVCANNLHEINIAWQDSLVKMNREGKPMMGGWGGWVGLLGDSVHGQSDVFICPEDEQPAIAPEATVRVLSHDNVTFKYFMPLEEGPLTRKIVEGGTEGYPGYTYRLEFEDIRPGGGDLDFNDLVMRVTVMVDGTLKVTFVGESAGYHFNLEGLGGELLMRDMGHDAAAGSFIFLGGRASYAINAFVRNSADRTNSIFFMDYVHKTSADPDEDDWDNWLNDDGVPAFGRHPGGQANVMMRDGGVSLRLPHDIDFDRGENLDRWWKTQ